MFITYGLTTGEIKVGITTMSTRWSESETCIFAKLYLSHPVLWNSTDKNYKSRTHRQEALRQIISTFGMLTNIIFDENEAKRKIKNLRSTYSQELTKIRERSTSTSTYQSTLKWFSHWHKCVDQYKRHNEERSSCDETLEGGEDSEQKMWVEESNPTTIDEDSTKDPFGNDSNTDNEYILFLKSEPELEEKHEIEENKEEHKPFKAKKRKIKRKNSLTIDKCNSSTMNKHIDNNADRNSDTTIDSTSKEDEFDIYGKYIASQLRGMGLERALRVQLQIQSIVSEARLKHLSNDHD